MLEEINDYFKFREQQIIGSNPIIRNKITQTDLKRVDKISLLEKVILFDSYEYTEEIDIILNRKVKEYEYHGRN
ncbi:MAG: hypothetical protein WCX82_03535 [archaeon]|jgi:hypothetical protein